jgi:methylthioribose-1-phosphate isomerase
VYSEAIRWTAAGAVELLDQTVLPDRTVFLQVDTIDGMVEAIRQLRVRGAPLIGVAAAMGLAAASARAAREGRFRDGGAALTWLTESADVLGRARPTAVNLLWALRRMTEAGGLGLQRGEKGDVGATMVSALRAEAQAIWDDDARRCQAIGEAGVAVIPDDARVLTICNTGMLATGGIGTAFGVIRTAHERGRLAEVIACETRPLRQGARLTAWEIARAGIPGTVIVDGAVATMMRRGLVDLAIAGADRIAASGDTANKIGTLGMATLAHAHSIPFYIAAPLSTIDIDCSDGESIPIEERSPDEIGIPAGVRGHNPAFDVTPARLISGIITEVGVLRPPFGASIASAFGAGMAGGGQESDDQVREV